MTSDLGGVTINEKIYPPNNVPHTGELERQIQALKDMGFVVSYPTLKGPDGYYQATSDKDGKALVSADPNQSGLPYLPPLRQQPQISNLVPRGIRTIAASVIPIALPPHNMIKFLFTLYAFTGVAPSIEFQVEWPDTAGNYYRSDFVDFAAAPNSWQSTQGTLNWVPLPPGTRTRITDKGTTATVDWQLDCIAA